MSQPDQPRDIHCLLLSDDLMFNSRISGTARDCGFTVRTVRNGDALMNLAAEKLPRCVIIDLSNPGLNLAALMDQLKALGDGRPFVVAYGSHVDTATLAAARAAGCDRVLPRSQFVQELQSSLPTWIGNS